MADADRIIEALDLAPHPEGGFFRETFRDSHQPNGRAASTAIFYLLRQGEISRWHRIDAAEIWHHYVGAPMELKIADKDGLEKIQTLGPDILSGQSPQVVIPRGYWQSASSCGDWTLVGCTVAPGFEFEYFEMLEGVDHPGDVATKKPD